MTERDLLLAKLGLAASTSLTLLVIITSATIAVMLLRHRPPVALGATGWALLGLLGFTLTTGAIVPNPTASPLDDPAGWLTVQAETVPFYIASGFLLAGWVLFLSRVARRHSAIPTVDTGAGE